MKENLYHIGEGAVLFPKQGVEFFVKRCSVCQTSMPLFVPKNFLLGLPSMQRGGLYFCGMFSKMGHHFPGERPLMPMVFPGGPSHIQLFQIVTFSLHDHVEERCLILP